MRAQWLMVLGVLIVGLVPMSPVSAQQDVQPLLVLYEAPVDDPIIDGFRPPAHYAGPGNRGLEFDSPAGRHVRAAAPGAVQFAGSVAGIGVVTVQHADGVRTTYTGFDDVWAAEGEFVESGWVLGAVGGAWHFGARIFDHYLDPQILIDASQAKPPPRLIPPPEGD